MPCSLVSRRPCARTRQVLRTPQRTRLAELQTAGLPTLRRAAKEAGLPLTDDGDGIDLDVLRKLVGGYVREVTECAICRACAPPRPAAPLPPPPAPPSHSHARKQPPHPLAVEDMADSLGQGTDGVRTMTCGHRFHARCLHRLLVTYGNDKCPLCRATSAALSPATLTAFQTGRSMRTPTQAAAAEQKQVDAAPSRDAEGDGLRRDADVRAARAVRRQALEAKQELVRRTHRERTRQFAGEQAAAREAFTARQSEQLAAFTRTRNAQRAEFTAQQERELATFTTSAKNEERQKVMALELGLDCDEADWGSRLAQLLGISDLTHLRFRSIGAAA